MTQPLILFANNRLGLGVARILREAGASIVGVVVHPPERATLADDIVAACGVGTSGVREAPFLESPDARAWIEACEATLGVSAGFAYLLRAPVLDSFPRGVVNLHTSLLPWNRGVYPNVWSIIDKTPAGVTLHWIDAGVDTGDIIAQREVAVLPTDTGATLYVRQERAALDLFRETWPLIEAGTAARQPQPTGGTSHRLRDVQLVDEVNLEASVRAGDLIDLLRARTFAPHKGAFFTYQGLKIYLRLELEAEDTDA